MSANIITVRTLSQLPRIENSNAISADTLFEVCPVKDSSSSSKKYSDAGVTYGVLSARINSDVDDAINKKYELDDLSAMITDVVKADMNFSGKKILTGELWIKDSTAADASKVVTQKDVGDIMASSAIGFINSACAIHTIDISEPWQFSGTTRQTKPVEMTASGNLYVYGWLADQGNIAPA